MLVVLMMAFLVTLQWSLAAAALCALWRRAGAAQSAVAARATALVPLLTLLAALCLLSADHVLIWNERILLLLLAALTGSLWLFGFIPLAAAAGRPRRLLRTAAWPGRCWIALSALLQGAFLLTSTWVAVNGFMLRNPYMGLAWRWKWLILIAAVLAGALLSAVALAGTLASLSGEDPVADARPLSPARGLPGLIYEMLGLVMLRALILAGSVWLWAHACPFGGEYFVRRLVDNGFHFMVLRVLLGLLLPLFFGLLTLLAWHGEGRRQISFQLLPALIVVLISEMIAASLTVGLGGMAF